MSRREKKKIPAPTKMCRGEDIVRTVPPERFTQFYKILHLRLVPSGCRVRHYTLEAALLARLNYRLPDNMVRMNICKNQYSTGAWVCQEENLTDLDVCGILYL